MGNVILEDIVVEGKKDTFFTPEVNFDASTGVGHIKGESYLEDSFAFYDAIIDWVNTYFELGNDQLEINFKLTYFNTSSSRALLDLLRSLQEHREKGKNVTINWFYPNPDDDELKMEAEDFMEEAEVDMNLIEYPAET